MEIYSKTFSINTKGNTDILDISQQVASIVSEAGLREGHVHVSVAGSTASITSIEYESGVIKDLEDAIERLTPRTINYYHDARWGDGNGYAHVRAALLGNSATYAVTEGRLFVGTWQQIVLIDFDNRSRNRNILVQLIGNR